MIGMSDSPHTRISHTFEIQIIVCVFNDRPNDGVDDVHCEIVIEYLN